MRSFAVRADALRAAALAVPDSTIESLCPIGEFLPAAASQEHTVTSALAGYLP